MSEKIGVHPDCHGCQFGDPENYPCQYDGDPASCELRADKAFDFALRKLRRVIGIQIGQISELRQALLAAGWLPPCEGRKIYEGDFSTPDPWAWSYFNDKEKGEIAVCDLIDDGPIRLILDPLPKEDHK